MRLRSFAIGVLTTLSSCTGPTFLEQKYPGEQRPAYALAILRVNGSDVPRLLRVDEQAEIGTDVLPLDARLHVELLPGRHVIVAVKKAGTCGPERIAFDAEAGRVYRVRVVEPATPEPCAHTLGIFEVDRGDDHVVRDAAVPVEARR